MKYLLAGIIGPLFWLLTLSTALWMVRRYWPRAESILFASPLTLLRRAHRAIQAARHRSESTTSLPLG
jgi:hypothetical protein